MSRGGFKIERNSDYEYERSAPMPNWLEQFANSKSDKTAVEVARERGPSIYDQMSAIMGGNKVSPYSSVDEAVKDYQKRTGLLDYQKMANENETHQIAAQIIASAEETKEKKTPEILERHPEILNCINNIIDTQYGIQLPAILQTVLEIFGRDISESDLSDKDLARYICDLIVAKQPIKTDVHDANIGRGVGTEKTWYEPNDSNRNPFIGLMPSRMY